MKSNVIKEKSFNFAFRIVKLYKYIRFEKKEYVISKQILRSGTALGESIEEALQVNQNRISFINYQL